MLCNLSSGREEEEKKRTSTEEDEESACISEMLADSLFPDEDVTVEEGGE